MGRGIDWSHFLFKEWKSIYALPLFYWASLVAQMVKNLPAMQEIQVWSLGWDYPLEKGMATHSSVLAWRIPWPEEPGRVQSLGSQRVRHDWVTNTFSSFYLPHLWSHGLARTRKDIVEALWRYRERLSCFPLQQPWKWDPGPRSQDKLRWIQGN